MHQEFLDAYNQELRLFMEHTKEFAEEYPGIAERLGGLVGDRMDPMVAGLLEGAAFLAARVQLKLKHEFPEFTTNLLEQLVPNYLAPTPSALLAGIRPPFSDPGLREGLTIPRGSYIDATYLERERRVACRYRLGTDVTLWPFDVAAAEYIPAPGPLQALGLSTDHRVLSGLRLTLTHRTSADPEQEPSAAQALKTPTSWFAGCRCKELSVHLLGAEADAVALYEQLFGDCVGIYFRHLDEFGDPVITPADGVTLEQIGFGEDEALLPADTRVFRGFDLLRELFWFPRKFLGFRLSGLARIMPKLTAKTVDVIFVFDEVNTRLAAAVQKPRPRSTSSRRRWTACRCGPTSTSSMSCPIAAARSTMSRTACSRSTPIMPAGARSSPSTRSIPRRKGPPRRMDCSIRSAVCRAAARSPSAGSAGPRTIPARTCSSRWSSPRASQTVSRWRS